MSKLGSLLIAAIFAMVASVVAFFVATAAIWKFERMRKHYVEIPPSVWKKHEG